MDFNIGETFEVFMAVAILTVAIVMVISASPPNYLHHISKDPTLLWYHLGRQMLCRATEKDKNILPGTHSLLLQIYVSRTPPLILEIFLNFAIFLTPSLISCILQSWLNLRLFWLFTSGTSYVELIKLTRCLCQLLPCLLRPWAGVFDKKCLDL